MKKYFYKNEPIEEEVWRWQAVYNDGSVLNQFDEETNSFHKFDEIKKENLFFIKIFSNIYPQSYILQYEKGMKIKYFYYRYCFNAKTENEQKLTIYCLEYEINNDRRCMMIMPNGELIVTSNPEGIKLEI